MNYQIIHPILVDFYTKIQEDILIGFHFKRIKDMDAHIIRITNFWELQLTGKMTDQSELPYNLITAHNELGLTSGMIDRWVLEFEKCIKQHLGQEDVDQWMKKVMIFKKRLNDFIRLD